MGGRGNSGPKTATPPWDWYPFIASMQTAREASVPVSAVGQLNQSSASDLPSTRRNRDGQPDTIAAQGGLARFWLKPIEPWRLCASFSWRGGREGWRENLPIKLLKHAAAEANNSIYSQWHSLWAGDVKTSRSIQQLIDDDHFLNVLWLRNYANFYLIWFNTQHRHWIFITRTQEHWFEVYLFISPVVTQFNMVAFNSCHSMHLTL